MISVILRPHLPAYLTAELFFMEKRFNRVIKFCQCSIIMAVSVLFISCNFYNFSQPQPYDKEKLYQFPDELLGKWKEKDTVTYGIEFDVPLNGKGGSYFNAENDQSDNVLVEPANEDSAFYRIYKDYLVITFSEKKKVLTGAWPKLNKKKEFVYPPEGFQGEYEIRYDTLKRPVDTVAKHIISGSRIYGIEPDRFLTRGYDYTRVKDTISILERDSVYIDLGQNAFLHKLTDSLYVFNINNSILSLSEGEGWWRLIILEIAANGQLNQWECNSNTGKLPCMFYERPSKYDQFYFDCRWSTADMLRLMKEGYFEKTAVMYRVGK